MENKTSTATEPMQDTDSKMFTQDEVNELMGKVRRETRAKFADYDELRVKAQQYDAVAEANKTELEKALERAQKAESELEQARTQQAHMELVTKVAQQTGVPVSLLHGNTEEELVASAQTLLEWQSATTSHIPADKGGAAAQKPLTKEEILSIKNGTERVRAIAANKQLFI